MKAFAQYLPSKEKDSIRKVEDGLQLAFLKTFPKNVCLAADEDLEYPFYMMIRDKMLMKVHGTSVVTVLAPKPKWVCCQNLVLSSVTGRPMARVLVPIKNDLLEHMYKIDYKKAIQMERDKLPQKLAEMKIPTAILKFFRSKNHNETIQKELADMKAYLETDEDREAILYFYVKSLENEKEHKSKMVQMQNRLKKYAQEMIKKKHYSFIVSDRTKMQVNERGHVIDILGAQEFLGFIVKSVNKEIIEQIDEIAKELKISSSLYFASAIKDRNLTTVQVNDKRLASKLFTAVKDRLKKFQISCNVEC